MNLICYLVVQGVPPRFGSNRETRRETGQIRVTKKKPDTKKDEISIRIDADIPDSLFVKPTLEAKISLPEGVARGPEISAEVAQNISEIIQQQTGMVIRLSADNEEP